MAEAKITSDQFLAGLKKNKGILSKAAKTTPQSFLNDEAIIALFELDKSAKTVDFKLSKVNFGIDKNKNHFVRFAYTVTTPEYNGTRLSENFTLDSKDKEKYEKVAGRMYHQFQRVGGYDTKEWGDHPDLMVAAITQLNEEKPDGQMAIDTYTPPAKKGQKARTFINYNVVRMYGPDGEEADDAEDNDDEGVEVDETEVEADEDEGEGEDDGISEEPDETWIGAPGAVYNDASVEIRKWNARKSLFTVYDPEADESHTVSPDDLTWDNVD